MQVVDVPAVLDDTKTSIPLVLYPLRPPDSLSPLCCLVQQEPINELSFMKMLTLSIGEGHLMSEIIPLAPTILPYAIVLPIVLK